MASTASRPVVQHPAKPHPLINELVDEPMSPMGTLEQSDSEEEEAGDDLGHLHQPWKSDLLISPSDPWRFGALDSIPIGHLNPLGSWMTLCLT